MTVDPSADEQPLHKDADNQCYHTIIIPLTFDSKAAGGTHFTDLDWTFNTYGSAVVFAGDVEHYGLANKSTARRVFLMCVVGQDPNDN